MPRSISPAPPTDNDLADKGKHLAIIAATPEILEENCGLLVQAALSCNCSVSCLAPGFPHGRATQGLLAGALLRPIEVRAGDSGALKSRLARASIADFFHACRPDAVIVSGIAALPALGGDLGGHGAGLKGTGLKADLKISCLITPSDEIAINTGTWWRRRSLLHKLAHCETIFTSDRSLYSALCQPRSMPRKSKVVLTPGPGCDLQALQMQRLPPSDDLTVVFLNDDDRYFLQEFSDIARQMHTDSRKVKFIAARQAGYATNADRERRHETWLEYRTYTSNREIDAIAPAHIVVLGSTRASYPPSLMTALAVGRPIVAKDSPAMRDAIDEVVNGVLVSDGETKSLALAIKLLLRQPDLLASMGRAGRAKAERKFDRRKINAALLAQLEIT